MLSGLLALPAGALAIIKLFWGGDIVRKVQAFLLSVPIKTLLIVAAVCVSYLKGCNDEKRRWQLRDANVVLQETQRINKQLRDEIARDDADATDQTRRDETHAALFAALRKVTATNPNRGVCIRADFLRKLP